MRSYHLFSPIESLSDPWPRQAQPPLPWFKAIRWKTAVWLGLVIGVYGGLSGCTQLIATSSPSPVQTAVQPTSTPIELGEMVIVEAGGFRFRPPRTYLVETDAYVTTQIKVSAPGALPGIGPAIMLWAVPAPPEMTAQDVLNQYQALLEGVVTFSEPVEITLAGETALQSDLQGTLNGVEVSGQGAFVAVPDQQAVGVVALAPVKQWPQLEPNWQAVRDSLELFTPKPPMPRWEVP